MTAARFSIASALRAGSALRYAITSVVSVFAWSFKTWSRLERSSSNGSIPDPATQQTSSEEISVRCRSASAINDKSETQKASSDTHLCYAAQIRRKTCRCTSDSVRSWPWSPRSTVRGDGRKSIEIREVQVRFYFYGATGLYRLAELTLLIILSTTALSALSRSSSLPNSICATLCACLSITPSTCSRSAGRSKFNRGKCPDIVTTGGDLPRDL